jgi:hypothetical protein
MIQKPERQHSASLLMDPETEATSFIEQFFSTSFETRWNNISRVYAPNATYMNPVYIAIGPRQINDALQNESILFGNMIPHIHHVSKFKNMRKSIIFIGKASTPKLDACTFITRNKLNSTSRFWGN